MAGFKRANTEEQVIERISDIQMATSNILIEQGYDNVSVTEIAKQTNIKRTMIYNYYKNVDDIMLDLLTIELYKFNANLKVNLRDDSAKNVVDVLAHTFSRQKLLLKLLSLQVVTIQQKASEDKINDFREEYISVRDEISKSLSEIDARLSHEQTKLFINKIMIINQGLFPVSEYSKDTDYIESFKVMVTPIFKELLSGI
ncbi:MAG: TetR/AcrR family transcriptional regulator [Mycoplasmatales bacterium]